MAKLSLSVSGDNKDSAQKPQEQAGSRLSITKKVSQDAVDEAGTSSGTASLSQKVESQQPASNASEKANGVAEWLLQQFGNAVFEELVNNPNLKLPYSDEDIDVKTWLERNIKTLFSQDSISSIFSNLGNSQPQQADDAEVEKIVKERMDQKVEKYNAKFQELRNEMESLEGEKAALQSKLNKVIEAESYVREIFRDRDSETDAQKRIAQTLNEAISQTNDEKLPTFIIRFSKGWMALQYVLQGIGQYPDDKAKLEAVYPALSRMMTSISGCYVSDRRTVLDLVAKHCNEFFSDYDFISPEQTLNADPEIHNASGIGNASIKEGLSFAVVRRDTKKTVKYADIKV